MKILAIIEKQWKDTLKNKTVLIQFLLFPLLTVIMDSTVKIEGMPKNFFVNLFAVMYVGMAPLTAMAAVLSEEKEKNTLRVLLMSGVKPLEYLAGVGGYTWAACMAGSLVFCFTGGFRGLDALYFMGVMAVGILVSLLLGAAIGTWCRNQMAATSVTMPVMMVLSFLPMLAMFNDIIAKIARGTYTQQIALLLGRAGDSPKTAESAAVIALNLAGALAVFSYACYKNLRSAR